MTSPLEGYRVLDLSRVLAGPICGRLLADLGADVIKIEAPEGDLTRRFRPAAEHGSAYFAQQNAGKRNVGIDLGVTGAAALLGDLAVMCDVVLENFRPGVLARYDLDYESLQARNERIVMVSVSGYGQRGLWSDRRAYAPLVHAEAGILDMVADKRDEPVRPEVQSHGDAYLGIIAATGILAALLHRERTGVGQHVDVSMAEALLWSNEWAAVELTGYQGESIAGSWNSFVATTADGRQVAFAGNVAISFPRWAEAMGRPELLDDPRFSTVDERATNRAAMVKELHEFVATFASASDVEAALVAFHLPVGEVRTLGEFVGSDWAVERELTVEADVGVVIPRSPYRSSGASVGADPHVAAIGEHNTEVLSELLGYEDEKIAALAKSGVLHSALA